MLSLFRRKTFGPTEWRSRNRILVDWEVLVVDETHESQMK